MKTEAQKRAREKYNIGKTKLIATRFILAEDADVIERLFAVPNRRKYLLGLVRADIKAHPNIDIHEDADYD